jgi:serine/threonine protein kinase
MPLPSGTRLGPYQIVGSLGAGGMGEVYRAEDSRLHRTVALKVLAPDVATPDRIARFEQEARAASALNHPNILTIHDVGREGDIAYFAMEWVDGQTLRDLLRSGPIPLRRTLTLAHQIAEGLAKAHAAGIVHRDLKPENVMVTGDGLAKIVDFGLAKLHPAMPGGDAAGSEADPTMTHAGTAAGIVMGTIGYMSPEQASGHAVDYRSDQFALGLLIYELVTRTRPFERATTAQSMAATIEVEPAPIETLNPEVQPHLAAVVARCLAKDPNDRYESTRDLARDLKGIAETQSRGPISTGASRNIAVTPSRSLLSTRSIAAISVIILIAAAAAGAWLWRSRAAVPAIEPSRPLIAVRPFRSLSADPQQGYFAAGMTEEIRGQLSQVASLRLLSRNGLDGYKEGEVSRAVRELGVANFVDGSVRVEGNRVRVTAELVDASNQQTLWSHQYDQTLADMLAVQSDIALQITRALHARLSPGEQERLKKRPTENAEAYSLYLQAQEKSAGARADNFEGMELLRKALALDPRFALAQARLAYRLIFMGYFDEASYIDKGIAEAQAALRNDESLPHAYFALGTAYAMKGLEAQSRQAFLRALELDPNHIGAIANFSILELTFGRLDESLYWGRRYFALSGKRGGAYYHFVIPMVNLRVDALSRRLLEDAERRFPRVARNQMMLAILDLFDGNLERLASRVSALGERFPEDEEMKLVRADLAFLVNSPDLESALAPLMQHAASNAGVLVGESVRLRYGYVLAKRGESARAALLIAEAERIAREKIEAGNQMPPLRVEMAAAAVLRKDTNAALEWLAQAHERGYRDYGFLERDPILAELRTTARFGDILDRMRKDVDARRARAEERGLFEVDSLLAPAR